MAREIFRSTILSQKNKENSEENHRAIEQKQQVLWRLVLGP